MAYFADNESFQDIIHRWPDRGIDYLYEHYYESLVLIAERKTHDRKAAEDIVQETLTEVWQKSELIGTRKGLLIGPYMIRIVRNKSISFYYQKTRREEKQALYLWDQLVSSIPSREWEMIRSDECKRLREIVSTLPARERACTEMRFLQEMSIGVIATRLGISIKAVEKNITRALKRLRKAGSSMS